MYISWLGESCTRFHVLSQILNTEVYLLFDPYHESPSGSKLSKLTADIVAISDPASPLHNARERVRGRDEQKVPFVIDCPGEYEAGGVVLYGIRAENEHWNPPHAVTLFYAEIEGMKILSLGAFGQAKLTDAQMEIFEHIDVLIVPLGSAYHPTVAECAGMVSQIEPRVVIPLPASAQGKKHNDALVTQFAKELGITPDAPVSKCKIIKKELPAEEIKIITLSLE